jgi:CDP-diacylglycerol pyrophosphatase
MRRTTPFLRSTSLRLGIIALAGLALIAASRARAADPDALWHVVHDLCVTDMKVSGAPAPCSKVDLAGGYAVLKDIRGDTQLLLIPTDRVTGIESSKLFEAGSPNYWQAAWDALPLFEQRTGGRPVRRGDVALAINSLYGRTQNQLHIHIDCVRPSVQQILADNQSKIGEHWSDLGVTLTGHHYRVRRLMGADFGARDPFKLLADDPTARADMSLETMVAIGATFPDGRPGFILLARAGQLPFDKAAGEELQDHSCAVLGPRP